MAKKITKSSAETKTLGKEMVQTLKGGEVLALFGDLGSGKTTFCQGVGKGLKIKDKITSPSFVIMNQYSIPNRELKLCHFDFYRYQEDSEQSPAELTDYLGKSEYICLIEWAEKVADFLPKDVIKIEFKYISDDQREINIRD